LHEALGFIAFIVPAVLIAAVVIFGLIVAGIGTFIALAARENRKDRKRAATIKAARLKARERACGMRLQ
jgi:hypothetical protein